MAWRFKPAAELFSDTAKDWDALNAKSGNHLLLDSRFVGPLLRHFNDSGVMLGVNSDSRLPGMALVRKKNVGIWETFQPSQAPMGLIVLGFRDETGQALLDFVHALPGHALEFAVLQQDPDHTSLPSCPTAPLIERVDYIQTARLPIQGTFEDYWKSRGTNLRHNLARRRRRMAEQNIDLELRIVKAPGSMAECIREYGRLESTGWKGKNGTAVVEDHAQGRFYREMLERFGETGEATVYQWLVKGKIAASDLCLERNGMMIVLKTAYDEEMNQFSPALMMREEIMKHVYAGGMVHVIEFYGRVMDWHTKWCDGVRTMFHLNFFREPWVVGMRRLVSKIRN